MILWNVYRIILCCCWHKCLSLHHGENLKYFHFNSINPYLGAFEFPSTNKYLKMLIISILDRLRKKPHQWLHEVQYFNIILDREKYLYIFDVKIIRKCVLISKSWVMLCLPERTELPMRVNVRDWELPSEWGEITFNKSSIHPKFFQYHISCAVNLSQDLPGVMVLL